MKIVILCRILWTAGAPKLAIRQAKELSKLGHDVRLVFLRGSNLGGYEDLLSGLDYEVVSETGRSLFSPVYDGVTRIFRPDRGSESRIDYNLIRTYWRHLERDPVDWLICHDQWAGLAGRNVQRKLGIPYAVFAHESVSEYTVPILGRYAQAVEREVFTHARQVLAVSEPVGRSIRERYGVSVLTNYIGMDIEWRTEFSRKENGLIAVSMWDRGRKPEVYLSLLRALPTYKLLMVGRWREQAIKFDFLREAERMQVRNRLELLEGISEEELHRAYSRCKFYVRFGFGEHGSGSTVEAISHCTPLIVNDELGTADLIQEYSAGVVVSDTDVRNIVLFVESHDTAEDYKRLQDNITRMAKVHSWKAHVDALLPSEPGRRS